MSTELMIAMSAVPESLSSCDNCQVDSVILPRMPTRLLLERHVTVDAERLGWTPR
ncbi:MAG: hypothetical protein HYR51_00340 [Candidatus Rokubacteria bacterium]|nr:hypothetical protein [Candidatus Rokubacteria bacterium]